MGTDTKAANVRESVSHGKERRSCSRRYHVKSMQNVREETEAAGILTIMLRGARMRCPRCSHDSLYQRWNVLKHHCAQCGYGFEEREGNCWFFLYSTTAALTGLFLVVMLLWRPSNLLVARVVLTGVAIGIIPLSLPIRKGIALALEYLSEVRGGRLLLYEPRDQSDDSHE